MRIANLAMVALAIGCAPKRGPLASDTEVRVDTATVAVPADPEQIARVRAAGTQVDTIIVDQLIVELRVGQAFAPWTFKLRPLDAAGMAVQEFIPAFIFADSDVIRATAAGIQALAPGTASVYVEALPRGASEPRPRPSTEVRFVVTP